MFDMRWLAKVFLPCQLAILLCKAAPAESDWMESAGERRLPDLATVSRQDLGLDFDWAILKHACVLFGRILQF